MSNAARGMLHVRAADAGKHPSRFQLWCGLKLLVMRIDRGNTRREHHGGNP